MKKFDFSSLYIAAPAFFMGAVFDRLLTTQQRRRSNSSPIKAGGGSTTIWSSTAWSLKNEVVVPQIKKICLQGVEPVQSAPMSVGLTDGWCITIHGRGEAGGGLSGNGIEIKGKLLTTPISTQVSLTIFGDHKTAGFHSKCYESPSTVKDATPWYGKRYQDKTCNVADDSKICEHMGQIDVFGSKLNGTLEYMCVIGECQFWLE